MAVILHHLLAKTMKKKTKQAIIQHAKACYPAECCGVIINDTYYPCTNIAPLGQFEIDPSEYLALQELGEIQAIVHSHPDGEPLPSEVDRVQMGLHGIPWVICGFGDGYESVRTHKPKAYKAPLLGRDYIHGLQDCYSLVRDYYKRELSIDLPDFERVDDWWENPEHEPLYERNFGKAGFERVHDLQKHDVILCRVGRTYHVNHALIYLGDGKLKSEKTPNVIGNHLVIHHPHGRLSVREIYGESWQKRTAMIVRYKHEND